MNRNRAVGTMKHRMISRVERSAADNFVRGAATGDVRLMISALRRLVPKKIRLYSQPGRKPFNRLEAYFALEDFWDQLNQSREWTRIARQLAALNRVPKQTQRFFARLVCTNGHVLRRGVSDDVALINAFRIVLPRYRGSRVVRLYRGQNALPPRSRTYGVFWTPSRALAERFRDSWLQDRRVSAVILETLAPPDAIISKIDIRIDFADGCFQPELYVVDRQRLRRVKVVSRMSRTAHLLATGQYPGGYQAYFEDDDGADADEMEQV
jgi:hypothetical protein